MANEMPPSSDFTGLTRKVIEYSEQFTAIMSKKGAKPTEADWAQFEKLVDVANFERHGVFTGAQAEKFGWETYKSYLVNFAGDARWEGTIRHVTEEPGRVILELEERNYIHEVCHVSNTVTIYEFGPDDRIRHLDVYVMPLD
jgi:hypothetical protein